MTDPVLSPDFASRPAPPELALWADGLRRAADPLGTGVVRDFLRGVLHAAAGGLAYRVPVPCGARGSRRFAWFRGRMEPLLEGMVSGVILDVEPVAADGWAPALARLVLRAACGVDLILPEGAQAESGGWLVQWRPADGSGEQRGPSGMEGDWVELGHAQDADVLAIRASPAGDAIEWPLAPRVDPAGGLGTQEPSSSSTSDDGGMESALKRAQEGWEPAGVRGETATAVLREFPLSPGNGPCWCAVAATEGALPAHEIAGRGMLQLACAGVRAVAWVGRAPSPGGVPGVGEISADPTGVGGSVDRVELWGVREAAQELAPAPGCRGGEALVLLGHPDRTPLGRACETEPCRLLASTVRGLVLAGMLRSASVGAREGVARTLLDATAGHGWVLDLRDPELARETGTTGFWSGGASACVLVSCALEDAGGVVARARLLGVSAWRLGVTGGGELRWLTEAGERVIAWPPASESTAPPAEASGA